MKKFICFLSFCVLLGTISAFAAIDKNPIMRVGLYYEEDAVAVAKLQNIKGSGYRLGFFDSKRNFISLLSTGLTKIAVAKDANLSHKNAIFYESGAPAGSKSLGAFHVESSAKYANAGAAEAAVKSFQKLGYYAFPAYIQNTWRVRIGSFTSTAAADTLKSKIGGTVVGNSKTCVTVYASESGSALFEYDGGTYTCLGVYPSLNTAAMPLTWFKSMQWYGGFEYPRNGGNMTIVNVVPMQYYIKGVIPYEMSPDSPLEALKAQAMCARTYAYYNTGKHGRLFDVCCTTDCQVYFGAERASNNSDRAVDETQGKYILYDGEPINAVFHSADGGATEDVENIWGSFIPYLRGKVDPYEDLEHALNGIWSYEYTPQELTDILNAKGYKAALISDAYVAEYTKLGNVLKVVFVDVNGKEWPFMRERARTIINSTSMKKYTRSQRYTIKRTGSAGGGMINVNGTATINPFDGKTTVIGSGGIITIPPDGKLSVITANGKESIKSAAGSSGNFIISGTGWGHNVGMSQEGAAGMAKKGFLAEDIIHFYFTGVTITK